MNSLWFKQLQNLFDCLGQDPIEDAPGLMDITGSTDEQTGWLKSIDSAIEAAERNDSEVISLFTKASGYEVRTAEQAKVILVELRQLYLAEIET